MVKPNKHGVLCGSGVERVQVCQNGAARASIKLAQNAETGKWGYGLDADWGGCAVGGGGFGEPIFTQKCTFDSREDALAAAERALKARVMTTLLNRRKWGGACGPRVLRDLKTIMNSISNKQQRRLFS